MAEEAEPRIQEKPAAHKAKMRRWIMATFGAVFILLLVNFMFSLASKTSKSKQPFELQANNKKQETTSSVGNNGLDSFDDLITRRQQRQNKRVLPSDNVIPGTNIPVVDAGGKYSQNNSTGSIEPKLSEEEKALAKWKQDEMLRALKSAKGNWEYSLAHQQSKVQTTRQVQSVNQGTQSNIVTNSKQLSPDQLRNILDKPMPENASLQEKRAEVKKRIEAAKALRNSLADISNSGEANSPTFVEKTNQLNNIVSQFDEPPSDIVGYTKENAYNADIKGKLLLPVGTEIPAQFLRKANSDINTSQIKGIVSHDVYDIDKRYVLIPKGSEIIMKVVKASTVNEVIQNRMGMSVSWLVLPNGKKIDLSKSVGLDREGMGAIKDKVDYHLAVQFLAVAAYAVVGSSSSYRGTGGDNDGNFGGAIGQEGRQQASSMAQKYLNILPTIIIRPGQSFYVALDDEVYVSPWKNIYEQYVN